MKQAAAVIGLGFVGRAHLEALRRVGVPVRGMLGGSRERDEQLRESLGLPRAYASLDDLAADPSVTVVHVCTPNHVHFDQATRMLRAGKHVLCEKPLAMDSRESEMLVKLAKDCRRVGGVAYNLRYYPLCLEAKAAVVGGVIGQPRLVHGSFLQDWLLFPIDWNWRLDPKLGGELRAVSDIGTHWLDLMMWITGRKVTEVCADLATVVSVRQRPRGRVETFQKAASLEHDDVPITTDGYAAYPGGHAEGYPDTFVQLFRDFYGYLDAGDFEAPRHFPTFATGNHELILCEAIAKSARDRAWVPVLWE